MEESMNNIESALHHEIELAFGIQENEIKEFIALRGSNHVYSFIVKNEKYVIHKLSDTSIMNWEQERAAYNSLTPLNITDKLFSFNNGIKITKFLDDSKELSNCESDMVDALDLLRNVHRSGASTKYDYNIIENMNKYILHCDNGSKALIELEKCRDKINAIQAIVNKLNIQKVLCHGDACAPNFLRLPDKSIRIIDWEQAGMADPLLDIAIAALHQGIEEVDPVWCLHQYLKRAPEKQEYLRLFCFLALDSYA
jgi:thiamine kinase-like enzyme